MKVNKIDHICIAVKDLEAARKIWEPILGKSKPDDPYVDEPEKIKVARYWLGGVGFELMESTSAKGYTFIGGARPFRNCEFAFVHPKDVNGVLLELIDYPWDEFKK